MGTDDDDHDDMTMVMVLILVMVMVIYSVHSEYRNYTLNVDFPPPGFVGSSHNYDRSNQTHQAAGSGHGLK